MKNLRGIINSVIKLISILIPLATATAVIYNQIHTRQCILEYKQSVVFAIKQQDMSQMDAVSLKNEILIAINEVINNELNASLELLIGLFGIIISVWVGLNIYNVMKKDDYNELLDTITKKCEEHDKIQKQVEDTYLENMELHISYLYKTFDVNNNSSQYFYSMFKDVDASKLDYKFLLSATFLETIYVKITSLHDRNEHFKMKPHIDEGIRQCKEMLVWIDANGKKITYKNKLLGYILYRYGRMFFYQGVMQYYVDSNSNKASDDFMTAANKLKEALKFDDDISHGIDIYNTLGYIYIKVYEWNVNDSETLYDREKLKEIISDALECCKKSKHETANSVKNLGIAYEHTNNLKLAIENYKKAIKKNPYDYSSRICLTSAYLKRVQKILGIERKRKKCLCDIKFDEKNKKESMEFLELAEFELKIAHNIDPIAANYYYKIGQLYTYRYLIEENGTKKKRVSIYARDCFEISNSLNPSHSAHRFHERNYYEAIGDISKSVEINENLDGGDVIHLRKLYESKLKIKNR